MSKNMTYVVRHNILKKLKTFGQLEVPLLIRRSAVWPELQAILNTTIRPAIGSALQAGNPKGPETRVQIPATAYLSLACVCLCLCVCACERDGETLSD